ncbi:hypothetical protein Taro_023916 [Colocasia esculenta]|uniref:Uncharacterized protein n=1 Tax=Colocasia esculenta TaxID=4460 RepID=A0A843V5E4_COLES|nr:hypothetical protein [Colocasia esculenta]
MGNRICGLRRRGPVEERLTRPQRLARQPSNVDYRKLRKLILSRKLAPCFDAFEDPASDLEECPICFFVSDVLLSEPESVEVLFERHLHGVLSADETVKCYSPRAVSFKFTISVIEPYFCLFYGLVFNYAYAYYKVFIDLCQLSTSLWQESCYLSLPPHRHKMGGAVLPLWAPPQGLVPAEIPGRLSNKHFPYGNVDTLIEQCQHCHCLKTISVFPVSSSSYAVLWSP